MTKFKTRNSVRVAGFCFVYLLKTCKNSIVCFCANIIQCKTDCVKTEFIDVNRSSPHMPTRTTRFRECNGLRQQKSPRAYASGLFSFKVSKSNLSTLLLTFSRLSNLSTGTSRAFASISTYSSFLMGNSPLLLR